MVTVYTIEDEYESACRLRYKMLDELSTPETYNNDIVIRWGNSRRGYTKDIPTEFKNVINPYNTISLNCKKAEALSKLSKVVHTPRMWKTGEEVPAGLKVVYRPTEHSGGYGFNVMSGPFVVEQGCYATQWLASDREIRVWFIDDRTMCGKRVPLREDIQEYKCRSMWGYSFFKKVPAILHLATLEAAKAIGLQVGAADVIWYDSKYYFLELNSAPTIDKQVIEDFYRNGFKVLLKKKFPSLV